MATSNVSNKANRRQKDFIAEIKTQGLARTNRFSVMFTPPKVMNEDNRRLMLFCEKASLPGINYATTSVRTFGETRETPYDRMFEPMQLTFHVDKKMTVKSIFDQWIGYIQNPQNRTFGWYNQYITPMTISVQDLEDNVTYLVMLQECYPKSVSAVQLDAEGKDTMRLDVTMQYKYWNAVPIMTDQITGLEKTAGGFNKYINDFAGFTKKLNGIIPESGNFLTGVVFQGGMKTFSNFTSRIPGIRF
jgi:hypothetical protein